LILRKYGFPSAKELMKEKHPTKAHWKKIVKETIMRSQERKWKKQIKEKITQKEVNIINLKIDGKVNDLLKIQKTRPEIDAAKTAVKFLINELPTSVNKFRIGKETSPNCIYCEQKYNLESVDNNFHITMIVLYNFRVQAK